MSGWIPCPADGWPEIAEGLAKPWPRAAAITDLRWWVDRAAFELGTKNHAELQDRIPGRVVLCRRWGWSDWSVRSLLRDHAAWWDAGRFGPQDEGELSNSSPGPLQVSPDATRKEANTSTVSSNFHQDAYHSPPSRDPSSDHKDHNPQREGGALPLLQPKEPKRKPTPQTATPEKRTVLDVWAAAYREHAGEGYPWGGDVGYRRALADATAILGVTGALEPAAIARLREHMKAFLLRPSRPGWAFKGDEPRTLNAFARQCQERWTANVQRERTYAGPATANVDPSWAPADDIPY